VLQDEPQLLPRVQADRSLELLHQRDVQAGGEVERVAYAAAGEDVIQAPGETGEIEVSRV
jgi:hypothetical protein